MMTRKDYNLIAQSLKLTRDTYEDLGRMNPDFPLDDILAALGTAAACLGRELRTTNPRFDEARFNAACGIPTE